MPISTDDRIDLIFKTQFGKLYTSSNLTLGQENSADFTFERDQIFGQEIPSVYMSDIVWSDRMNSPQIIEYGSKNRLLTGTNYSTQSYSSTVNITLLYKLSFNTITSFSITGLEYNIYTGRSQSNHLTRSHNPDFYDYSGNYMDFQTNNSTILKYITFNSDDEFHKNAPADLIVYGKNNDNAKWEYIKNFRLNHTDYLYDDRNVNANDIILDMSFNQNNFKNYRISVGKILNVFNANEIRIIGGNVLWTNSSDTNWNYYPWKYYKDELEQIGLKIYDDNETYISNITDKPIWIRIDLNPEEIEPYYWQMNWDTLEYTYSENDDDQTSTVSITTHVTDNPDIYTGTFDGNIQINAGYYQTYLLDSNNNYWSWGHNGYGQLGIGNTSTSSSYYTPRLNSSYTNNLNNVNIAKICNGYYTQSIITDDGQVYQWGYGSHGQHLNGSSGHISTPRLLPVFSGIKIKNITWGYHHALALTDTGNLYTWGYNNYGERGNGNSSYSSSETSPYKISRDNDNNSLTEAKFIKIAAATHHCYALRDDNTLYCWGHGSHYGLLQGNDGNHRYYPTIAQNTVWETENPSNSIISQIQACYYGGQVLVNGKVYGWGYNSHYNLGIGNTSDQYIPVKPTNVPHTIVKIANAFYSRYAIDAVGELWGWGYNGHGQMGLGTTTHSNAGNRVKLNSSTYMSGVTDVVGGAHHTIIYANGQLYGLGYSGYGQNTTNGNTGNDSYPVLWSNQFNVSDTQINPELFYTLENTETTYTSTFNYDKYNGNMQIVSEHYCTHILTVDGKLYGWGYNSYGEIGRGNTSNYNYPTEIASSYFSYKRIIKICRVCYHASCALTDEGEVYAWGNGSYGAFLKGNTSNYNTPQLLTWFSNNNIKIVDVTGGYYHWLALSDQGKIYTWGYNSHGQRGMGNTNSYNSETAPFELSDFDNSNNELYGKEVIFIKAREYHCMAVTSDNELYTWGDNSEYVLGHGNNTTGVYYPKKVNFNWGGTIVQIDAVYRGCMVLINNGTVYNWGTGGNYGLGNSSTSDHGSPVVPSNLNGVNIVKIAGGRDNFKFAVSADGTLYGWGYNNYNNLGLSHTSNVAAPIAVLSGVTDIITGHNCAFAVANGKIWSWGYGNYCQHRPWANNTSNIQIPEQWPDNFANNYMNGGTTEFEYEGSQIASDYINLNTLLRQFRSGYLTNYSENFYSAAWNDNPDGERDKIIAYELPIIRQIGPKNKVTDEWGSKLELYNSNSNTYHTSPNNYTSTRPWIRVTFLSDIKGMTEKPVEPIRNPHAQMNNISTNTTINYIMNMQWKQDITTRLFEKNGVPGDENNYWNLQIINLQHYRIDGNTSWIAPDTPLLIKKEDAEEPDNTLFNNSDKPVYIEISINDNANFSSAYIIDGQHKKKDLSPTTVDWFGNKPWLLYTVNDLSNNLNETVTDYYIREYPYIITLAPGEWITRIALPEYYNVTTNIPEQAWCIGNHYAWRIDQPRNSGNTNDDNYSWYIQQSASWWRINVYDEDPRQFLAMKPYNLQTRDNYSNPSNDGFVNINDFKIYGRDVFDVNDIFNGETHYDNPNKVFGYGNSATTMELLDSSNVDVTIITEPYTNAFLNNCIGRYSNGYYDTFKRDSQAIIDSPTDNNNGQVYRPTSCVYDTERDCLYISDYNNHAIRKFYKNNDGTVNLRTIVGYNTVGYNHENISEKEYGTPTYYSSSNSSGSNEGIFNGSIGNRTYYPGQMAISHDNKYLFWLYNRNPDTIEVCELSSGMYFKAHYSFNFSDGGHWKNDCIAIDSSYNIYINQRGYNVIVKIPSVGMVTRTAIYNNETSFFEMPRYEYYSGTIIAGCYNQTDAYPYNVEQYNYHTNYNLHPYPFFTMQYPTGIVFDNDDNLYIYSYNRKRLVKCGPEEEIEIPSYGRYDPLSSLQEPLNGNWYSSYDFFKWVYSGDDSYNHSTSWNGWDGKMLAFYFDDQYICSLRVGYWNHSYNNYVNIGFRNNNSQYGNYSNTIYFYRNYGIRMNFYYLYRAITQYVDKGSTPYRDMEQGKISSYDDLWPADLEPFKNTNSFYYYDIGGNGDHTGLNAGEQMVHRCKFKLHMRRYKSHAGHPTYPENNYASNTSSWWDSITEEQVGTSEATSIDGTGNRGINELYPKFSSYSTSLSYDKINNNIYMTQAYSVRKIDLDNDMFVTTIAGTPFSQGNYAYNNNIEQENWNSTRLDDMGNIGIDLSENLYLPLYDYHSIVKLSYVSHDAIFDLVPTTEEKLLTNIKEQIIIQENEIEVEPVIESITGVDLVDVLMEEDFQSIELQSPVTYPGDITKSVSRYDSVSFQTMTWVSQYNYAVNQGKRLPYRSEILDNQNTLEVSNQDKWVAGIINLNGGTGSDNRDWYQIGNTSNVYGKSYVDDGGGYPSWGDSAASHSFRDYIVLVEDTSIPNVSNVWNNLLPNGWGINTYNDHIFGSFTEFNGWRMMEPSWFCNLSRADKNPFYGESSLEAIHETLNETNYDAIISAITNGVYPINSNLNYNNNNISDGGADMYDGGNRIRTNLGGDFYYYEAINTSSYLAGNKYFTRLTVNKGLFIFVADLYDGGEGRTNNNNVSYIEIYGNLGADGGGTMTYGEYTSNYNGTAYKVYWKSVAGPGDPNVNHVWVVKDVPGLSRNLATSTDDDYHRLYIPTNGDVDRIYYFLWGAPTNNSVTNQTEVNSMLTKFFEITGVGDQEQQYPLLGETNNPYPYTGTLTEIGDFNNPLIGFIGDSSINTNSIKSQYYLAPNINSSDIVAVCSMGDNLNSSDPYNNSNTHSGLRTPELNISNYYTNSLEIEFQSNSMPGSNFRISVIYDGDVNNKVILLTKLAMTSDLYKKYKIPLLNPTYAQTMRVEFECWGNVGYLMISDVKITNNQKYTSYKNQFTNIIHSNYNFYTFTSSGTYTSNYNEENVFNGTNIENYIQGGWLANYNASQFGWDNDGYYNKQNISYSYYTEDVSGNVYNGPWIELERLTAEIIYYIEIHPTQNTNYANTQQNEGGRQPRDFRLYGSNNNLNHAEYNNTDGCLHCSKDWHLIQEWINIDSQTYWDGEYKHFTGIIDNPNSYKKYRLAINRITVPRHNYNYVNDHSDLYRLHIGAINLYGINNKVYNNILKYTSPETEQLSEIIIDTNNQSKVYYFKIYSSNIERGYDAPSDFKLLASNDNNYWTIIQEWEDIKPTDYFNGTKYLPYIGTLNTPTINRYWKLQITKSTGFKMQVKQFQLYGSEINLSKYIAGTTLSIEDYTTLDDSIDKRIGEEKRNIVISGFQIGGSWETMGNSIKHQPYSSNSGDQWGKSVEISGDGTTIISGAPYHDPNGNYNRGIVKVYEWNGTDWQQKGGDIVGTYDSEYLGGADAKGVAISYNGERIAYSGDNYNSSQGRVYVSEWNGSSWVQQTVKYGDSTSENFGRGLSMSDDGTVIAVGVPYDDDKGGNYGRVEIFKNTSGTTWTSWGSIYGTDYSNDGGQLYPYFGGNFADGVQLSGDGTKIVIGCYNGEDPIQINGSDEGAAIVLQIIGNNNFAKMGETIYDRFEGTTNNSSDQFGWDVAISHDGTTIAVASRYDDNDDDDNYLSNCGSFIVFKWSGTGWVQKGQKITGYTSNVECHGVELSADGNIVCGSFPYSDQNGSDVGYIQVLMYNSITERWDTMGTYRDIEGSDTHDENYIGYYGALSISSTGGIVVYGTYRYDLAADEKSVYGDVGIVRAYEYMGGKIYSPENQNNNLDDKTGVLSGPASITRNTTINYTASTEYTQAFYAFLGIDNETHLNYPMGWTSVGNSYSTGGSYTKEEKEETNNIFGEWLQINFGEQYIGTSIKLYQKQSEILRAPEDFAIFGSNDNVNWGFIKEWNGKNKQEWESNNYILTLELGPRIKLYKHWRLVIKKTIGTELTTPSGAASISQFELYGYKQQYINLQDYVYAGVNTIEEAFDLYGTQIIQSTYNIEPYKLVFDLSKNLINFYNLSSNDIEIFTQLKNESAISYDKNYNTTEFKVTGSYYANENMLNLFTHSYEFAMSDIDVSQLFNDKLSEYSLNLEFVNNVYDGDNGINGYGGDWIEIDTKIPIKVSEIKLYLDETGGSNVKLYDTPKEYKLYALNPGEDWIEAGTFITSDIDIVEEEISNYLPIGLSNNNIEIPGYTPKYDVLYTSEIIGSNDLLQQFEWNKNSLKIVPISRQNSTNNVGSINNLDRDDEPFVNAIYGHGSSYVWESEDNYDAVTGKFLIANSLVDVVYEHQYGEWLQLDLGESKPIGFMTLRPICGNTNKLLNPSPGSEITIYGSNNLDLWSEVKKLKNVNWGEPDTNSVLNYKLLEIDETASFRYWKLLFNKPSSSQTRVGLSEWKLYSPFSSLSNIITRDLIIDKTLAEDIIKVRTITKSVTLSSDYYRYWRLVINEKHSGLSNQIKLKQIEMRGLEFKHDNNLLTLWRPEINKPIENYLMVNDVSTNELESWGLHEYDLSNVNLIYRDANYNVYTNINKTFDIELFKDIKEKFNKEIVNVMEENKYMDVNTIEMESYIKSINSLTNSENKYDYIKRYENVELERVSNTSNNRAWYPKNNIMKEKLKNVIQGRTPFYFELISNMEGSSVINAWDQLFKPYINNGILVFLGDKSPLIDTTLSFKVFYTFEGYSAPNALVRQLENDPIYIDDEPYIFYNKTEKMNKITTGTSKELVPIGYDSFIKEFCEHPDKIENITEDVKYYEEENTTNIPSGWQKLPIVLLYDPSVNIQSIEGLSELIQDNDLLFDVYTHKIYRYTGLWEEYYNLNDLSNNCISTTAWTNATTGHYYSINPYTFRDISGEFIDHNIVSNFNSHHGILTSRSRFVMISNDVDRILAGNSNIWMYLGNKSLVCKMLTVAPNVDYIGLHNTTGQFIPTAIVWDYTNNTLQYNASSLKKFVESAGGVWPIELPTDNALYNYLDDNGLGGGDVGWYLRGEEQIPYSAINGDIHINVDGDNHGVYQYNSDLKTRNVIYRWDSILKWKKKNIFITNFVGETPYTDPSGSSCIAIGNFIALPIINRIKILVTKDGEALTDLSNITIFTKGDSELYRPDEFPNELRINLWTSKIECNNKSFGIGNMNEGTYKIELWYENNSFSMVRNKNQIFVTIN